jgi:hypothetical protein
MRSVVETTERNFPVFPQLNQPPDYIVPAATHTWFEKTFEDYPRVISYVVSHNGL